MREKQQNNQSVTLDPARRREIDKKKEKAMSFWVRVQENGKLVHDVCKRLLGKEGSYTVQGWVALDKGE